MVRLAVFLCVLPLMAGCGSKLRLEETFDLPVHGKTYEIDPVSKEQKVTISVKASEGPVDVSAYTEKQQAAAEAAFFSNKTEPFLGRERNKQEVTLQVTVPAQEKLFVNIQRSGKDPKSVTVKISN